MFHTKFGENRSRPSIFRLHNLSFSIFFIVISNFKIIHETSSVRKPKSSNILSQRKNFMKSVRKQYGNPDSHAIHLPVITYIFHIRSVVAQWVECQTAIQAARVRIPTPMDFV